MLRYAAVLIGAGLTQLGPTLQWPWTVNAVALFVAVCLIAWGSIAQYRTWTEGKQ